MMNATYSPEDNKLRLYSLERLDTDLYNRVRSAGFIWAPRQELFVAPMWTPSRADLLIELCGEIGDEETTLAERAEQRAERFSVYKDKRIQDAQAANKVVESITENISFGQPILVGHHSEKRARKDAERIENAMSKAVKAWETSEYWQDRAKGVIHHANYKDKPGVRVRRIKGLEADARRYQREITKSTDFLRFWNMADLTFEKAKAVSNHDHISRCFTLEKYPRGPEKSQYEGQMSLWSALDGGIIDEQQAKAIAVPSHERTIKFYSRWLAHTNFRLEYERSILTAQGHSMPVKVKKVQPPIINFKLEGFEPITKQQWSDKHKDYKGCRRSKCGAYRYRVMILNSALTPVFITDQKIVEPPKSEVRSA